MVGRPSLAPESTSTNETDGSGPGIWDFGGAARTNGDGAAVPDGQPPEKARCPPRGFRCSRTSTSLHGSRAALHRRNPQNKQSSSRGQSSASAASMRVSLSGGGDGADGSESGEDSYEPKDPSPFSFTGLHLRAKLASSLASSLSASRQQAAMAGVDNSPEGGDAADGLRQSFGGAYYNPGDQGRGAGCCASGRSGGPCFSPTCGTTRRGSGRTV